ncbi:ABC transporter substrate-binding protein [Holophaga foetida]|uniref:ABC transporter substrate-binding protein n=1 Tax=Holophaga foetida TaxID=35839 RepID=UPI000247539D|nr:ABC transporter substrate-binding protein [Holophaga foetida]
MVAGEHQSGRVEPTPKRRAPWAKWGGAALLMALLVWSSFRVARAVGKTLKRSGPNSTVSTVLKGGRATVRHAQRFSIEYRKDCKVIRVNTPWQGAREGFTYQLVPKGSRPKSEEPGAILIEIPVKRIVLLASTHLPDFVVLDRVESVVGIAGARQVCTQAFVERLRDGQVQEIADSISGMEKHLNYDRLFTLKPDLVFVTGKGNPALDHQEKLRESGFNVAICAESMENDPLGRAEWIKFMAAFLDRDAEAEAHFAKLEVRYEAQKAQARKAAHHPTVLCGMNARGAWFAPGGGSYVAAYIRDAGADYILKDDPRPGYRPIKIDAVLDRARDADFWMLHMTDSSLNSLQNLKDIDPRCTLFRAFREGKVFNTNACLGPRGGNDYWENGSANPDLVLADLISIFHPELTPGHKLRWHHWLRQRGH